VARDEAWVRTLEAKTSIHHVRVVGSRVEPLIEVGSVSLRHEKNRTTRTVHWRDTGDWGWTPEASVTLRAYRTAFQTRAPLQNEQPRPHSLRAHGPAVLTTVRSCGRAVSSWSHFCAVCLVAKAKGESRQSADRPDRAQRSRVLALMKHDREVHLPGTRSPSMAAPGRHIH
jgi:hypothetical protein